MELPREGDRASGERSLLSPSPFSKALMMSRLSGHSKVLETQPGFSVYLEGGLSGTYHR